MTQKWFQKATVQSKIVTGIFAIISAIIIGLFGLFQGWFTSKITEKGSPEIQNTDEYKIIENQNQADRQSVTAEKTSDTLNHSEYHQTQSQKKVIKRKYILTLSFIENDAKAKEIANSFKHYLERYEELEVQMEPIKTKKEDKDKYLITFLYRDPTQKSFIDRIWVNLPGEHGNIEKIKDATLDSEIKILIK